MTQAFNLSQLANGANTSGQLNASTYLFNQVPVANGGTALSSAGAAGNMLVASSASAYSAVTMPTFGYRNRIINGNMVVAQRGVTTSVGGSDTYTLDRWAGIAAGANFTVTQGSLSTRNVLVAIGVSGNTLADIFQRIESLNIIDLTSTTCTVSLDLFSNDGRSITWEVYSANSVNNFASKTLIATGALTTTSGSYVPRTFQFTNTAAAANGIELRFKFGALGSGTQCALSNVQLERGSIATAFDVRDYGRELIMCQRYYESADWILTSDGGNGAYQNIGSWQVKKRATPTVTTVTGVGGSFTPVGTTGFRQDSNPSGFAGCTVNGAVEL